MSGVLKMMPYPMQIGSGTYDLILGYSFQEILDNWSYGAQLNMVTRFDYNSEGWKYGDRRELNLWASKPMSKNLSISISSIKCCVVLFFIEALGSDLPAPL